MKCPNCNGEIGRFELAANCKHCGVNIFYSQQEQLLTRDAKRCELEYASFHILTAKLKTAFIGGPVQILRIISMVAAIGSVFIPFASISATLPMLEAKLSFGAFGFYQAFSDGTLMALLNLSTYVPDVFAASAAITALFLLTFLMGLGVFVCLALSFLNMKKTARLSCIFSAIGLAFCLGAGAIGLMLPGVVQDTFVQAKPGFGAFVCAAVLAFVFVLNLLVIRKNIKPEIKDVDLRRIEVRRKIKSGEISLDDLPLPVFESEEERAKRLEKEQASKNLVEKAKGGASNG